MIENARNVLLVHNVRNAQTAFFYKIKYAQAVVMMAFSKTLKKIFAKNAFSLVLNAILKISVLNAPQKAIF